MPDETYDIEEVLEEIRVTNDKSIDFMLNKIKSIERQITDFRDTMFHHNREKKSSDFRLERVEAFLREFLEDQKES